ncbi:multiple sugar transport system substrate-binding protein [Kineosphaera limosa]|uniref:Putative sugar ABC transporter substrate-binding protein n=1 Tax=Kineosphaera limosa NBRC 100340 TaxID=1184609 RepID=K6XC58_9MICO|nr:sugar ABC transporter substrate-binding protein [Kineosphaera limosa]NYE00767.1 multiple sugar transport system substrate-binding protein [Kineosphaera limosa]GAB96379.1 putative sugar ABC transporter substrate-binding protein [Kineosphaera limosa NBRC 100340]
MSTWRKGAAPAAALMAIAVGLSACGSSPAGGSTAQADDAKGEVVFWSFVKGSDSVAEAFAKAHPDIKVRFETQAGGPDYYAKLSNAVKSGAVPDVAVAEYTRLPEIVSLGAAQDLTEASGELVEKTFPESIRSLVTLGGKTWGVPRDAAPMMYYYRKDIFDKHGLTPAKTWDEYKTLTTKVKELEPKSRAGVFLTGDANILTDLSWQAGARWFDTEGESWKVGIDSEPTKKVAAYWQDLVSEKLVNTYPLYVDEFWQSVQKNETVGYVCASWCAGGLQSTVPDQSGKWAVAELPTRDGKPASAMWGGSSFIVPKGAKNPAAANKFIQWITTDPEGIAAWYGSGTSSMFPASPELLDVAKKSFPTEYFGGQDIFAVGKSSYDAVSPDWSWGPTMSVTDKAIIDRLGQVSTGSGNLPGIVADVQAETVRAMQSRGLTVAN